MGDLLLSVLLASAARPFIRSHWQTRMFQCCGCTTIASLLRQGFVVQTLDCLRLPLVTSDDPIPLVQLGDSFTIAQGR